MYGSPEALTYVDSFYAFLRESSRQHRLRMIHHMLYNQAVETCTDLEDDFRGLIVGIAPTDIRVIESQTSRAVRVRVQYHRVFEPDESSDATGGEQLVVSGSETSRGEIRHILLYAGSIIACMFSSDC